MAITGMKSRAAEKEKFMSQEEFQYFYTDLIFE